MHGQTNGHVVARREVSAEELSKQLEKRHFIHARSGAFSTWDNWMEEPGSSSCFFFFFPLGIVRVKSIQVKCDSGNTMWHHKLKQMGLLLMWKIWQQQQQTKSAATSCGHITSRFLINEISHRFNNFLINMIVKIQHPPRKEAATNDYYWWICWSSSL